MCICLPVILNNTFPQLIVILSIGFNVMDSLANKKTNRKSTGTRIYVISLDELKADLDVRLNIVCWIHVNLNLFGLESWIEIELTVGIDVLVDTVIPAIESCTV